MQEARVVEKVYTTKDLCRMFSVRRKTIWRWQKIGKLPEPISPGRWSRGDIDKFFLPSGVSNSDK